MSNIFVFQGVDHKVGTTMIACSVAEHIAKQNQDLEVLMISFSRRKHVEYLNKSCGSMADMKGLIESRLLKEEDLRRNCRQQENLYLLGGTGDIQEDSFYYPETTRYVLETVKDMFQIIIVDGGNSVNNGLTIGALSTEGLKYLVVTQQENMLTEYERLREVYRILGTKFEKIVVNQYLENDPHDLDYISKRIKVDKQQLIAIGQTCFSRQAEMDGKTLLEYREKYYFDGICKLSEHMLECIGLQPGCPEKKKSILSYLKKVR